MWIFLSPTPGHMFDQNFFFVKLLITSRTYIHRLSLSFQPLYIYYIIFFLKNQIFGEGSLFPLPLRPVAQNTFRFLARLTANLPHVLLHQRSAVRIAPLIIGWLLSKPTFEVFRRFILGFHPRTPTFGNSQVRHIFAFLGQRPIRNVTPLSTMSLAPADGLEPPNAESESAVLPLD